MRLKIDFLQYVFDAVELLGSEICDALKTATQLAFETTLIRRTEAQMGAVQLMEMINEGEKIEKTETSDLQKESDPNAKNSDPEPIDTKSDPESDPNDKNLPVEAEPRPKTDAP